MSELNLKALIIDPSQEAAQELLQSIEPVVQFSESEHTSSLRKGVVSHAEDAFEVCFVSSTFSTEELKTFFYDINQLGKSETCLFLKVKDVAKAGQKGDEAPPLEEGFAGEITRRGTSEDRAELSRILNSLYSAQEIKRRKLSVVELVDLVLKEIDRVAIDRRRGVKRDLISVPMEGVEFHTDFNSKVFEGYLESLQSKTEVASPRTIERLEIPEDVLQRALPHLTKEGYQGASHRVWELLAKKYGVEIAGQAPTRTSSKDKLAENGESPEEFTPKGNE